MPGLDPALRAQFQQTIYVASVTSVSNYGDPSYGAPVARKARVVQRPRRTTNATGEEIVTTFLLACEQEIKATDRVWLPGVDQTNLSLSLEPKTVAIGVNERGQTTHYEVGL